MKSYTDVEQSKKLAEILPNQEWSEEDEKMLNDAIGAVGAADYYTYDDKQEIETWLKSLKERYVWKPSGEQILALRWILNNIPYNRHKEEISGLLEQLKKLKE